VGLQLLHGDAGARRGRGVRPALLDEAELALHLVDEGAVRLQPVGVGAALQLRAGGKASAQNSLIQCTLRTRTISSPKSWK
jgi:hypothetical protein